MWGQQQQQPPLPPGWEAKYDPNNRRWFYINHQTKVTQWEYPQTAYQMQQQQQRQQQQQQQQQRQQQQTYQGFQQRQETSFIEPNPTKARELKEDYGIDIDMANALLRTHSNNVDSVEQALKGMGYKKKEVIVANEHYATQIRSDYPSASIDVVKESLVKHKNDYMDTIRDLQSKGYKKEVKPNETLVQQLKKVYSDASTDLIRDLLISTENKVGPFRTKIEQLGYEKGGKKKEELFKKSTPKKTATPKKVTPKKETSKPAPPKKAINKMVKDLQQKLPGTNKNVIEMCLQEMNYNLDWTEQALKSMSTQTDTTPKRAVYKETDLDELYKSSSSAPVVFGAEDEPSATSSMSKMPDYSKLFSSAATSSFLKPSFTTSTSSKPTVGSAVRSQARQKRVKVTDKKIHKSNAVNWKTSANRMKPNGPDPANQKGPDPSLLITNYIVPTGPNPAYYNGPQSTNRCGPLPGNRVGPSGIAVGPAQAVY